jgi:hypothetical protein
MLRYTWTVSEHFGHANVTHTDGPSQVGMDNGRWHPGQTLGGRLELVPNGIFVLQPGQT